MTQPAPSSSSPSEDVAGEAQPAIPLSVPHLNGNEWAYVKECLDTNWVSYAGSFVDRFEEELAAKVGARHAVATNSGTSALHVALLLAGVGRDDEVIVPDLTFVAPANAVRYCGAWPTFIDVAARDWQLDVDKLEDFLEEACVAERGRLYNRHTGRRIAALLPVHLLGGMGDVDAIAELAARYELPLIEDASECLGASYRERPIGAPPASAEPPLRIVTTSFNGNKIVTTGGGGALCTEDPELAARARHLTTTAKADDIEFYHDEVGYNYRMTNVAAAMGVAQLEQVDAFVETKRRHADLYRRLFASAPSIRAHPEPADCRSTFWLYTVSLDRPSRPVIEAMNARNVLCRPLWMPLRRLPAFETASYAFECEVSDRLYERAISLPCSVGLDEARLRDVVSLLRAELSTRT